MEEFKNELVDIQKYIDQTTALLSHYLQRKDEVLNRKAKSIEDAQRLLDENTEKALQKVKEAESKFESEKEAVAKIGGKAKSSDEIVNLAVGELNFRVAKPTLMGEEDSTLALMFKGQFPLTYDEDGRVFIDRNGKLFEHILEYLRGNYAGFEYLPRKERSRLAVEADFFQLKGLVALLKPTTNSNSNINDNDNSRDNSNSKTVTGPKKTSPDLSWMETTDNAKGFRSWKPFPNIRFAVSKENPSDFSKDWSRMKFDCPTGFHWCSTQEFLDVVGNSSKEVEYPYLDQEGWYVNLWNRKWRTVFLFSDSQTTGKFKHSGGSQANYLPNLSDCDTNYNFAGIVCIKDYISIPLLPLNCFV